MNKHTKDQLKGTSADPAGLVTVLVKDVPVAKSYKPTHGGYPTPAEAYENPARYGSLQPMQEQPKRYLNLPSTETGLSVEAEQSGALREANTNREYLRRTQEARNMANEDARAYTALERLQSGVSPLSVASEEIVQERLNAGDVRNAGYQYSTGQNPLPAEYADGVRLEHALAKIAHDAHEQHWQVTRALREVRLATTPTERNIANGVLRAILANHRV